MRLRVAIAALAAGTLVVGLSIGAAPLANSIGVLPPDADRRCAWSVVYPKDANYSWPDTDAAYIVQAVSIGPNEKVVITGRDPKARYWSITTYNLEDRAVIDRVNDVTVKRQGNGPSARWTVTVTPRHNAKDPNSLKAAPLPAKGQAGTFKNVTVIMYRVYLSDVSGYSGGPLPTIALHHADGSATRVERLPACREDQIKAPEIPLGLVPAEGVPSEYFVRAEGGRFYPSKDTAYLAAEVAFDPERILVVSGKAPTVGKDRRAQVRYWSICQNVNAGDLPVVDCASDRDVTLTNGHYTVAIVGPGQEVNRADLPGVTFLDWTPAGSSGTVPPAFLIMRHILPSATFKQSINSVELGKPASSAMGEYAPIIEQVPLSELRAR